MIGRFYPSKSSVSFKAIRYTALINKYSLSKSEHDTGYAGILRDKTMDNKLAYTLYSFIDLNYWWNNLDTEVVYNSIKNLTKSQILVISC